MAAIFQRRQFIILADILSTLYTDALDRSDMFALQQAEDLIRLFADRLARTNPRFKAERFLRACGLSS